MAERTTREQARADTLASIREIGRRHLATDGAAALSVRAVARDLGVVSSAIYRYVRSRDDLLTLLVVDGYDELGDAVDRALEAVADGTHRERFLAVGHAVRDWAAREPATYALLFGSPVPGYAAPAEQTVGPGTRVVRRLVEIFAAAHAGAAGDDDSAAPLHEAADQVRAEFGLDLPDDVVARGVTAWTGLFGCVSFERFGQYGDAFPALDDLFARQLELLAEVAGLSD